jgi:gamma-glutamylcyclotransferase (GGCT)/AIG2-like uncharacterized protein YtfP
MRLFLYGSLRDPAVLAERSGDPSLRHRWRAAELPGWRVVTLRQSRYPTLIRAPGLAAGIIAEVDAAALCRLQRYEGAAYRLRRVMVHADRATLPAHAWIAPGGTGRTWPPAGTVFMAFSRSGD